MRVLMLSQSSEAVGPAPGIARLLDEELRRLGSSVTTHSWGRAKAGESIVGRVLGTLRDVRSAARLTRARAFDVVLVHTSHDWRTLMRDTPLAFALRRRNVPVVLHLHGSRPDRLRRERAFRAVTSILVRSVAALLVLSRDEQEEWQAFTSKPVLVIRNPYSPRMSAIPVERPRADPATVLFVGRLVREKGIFELVDAMPHVAERSPCRLVVVGEGPCDAELAARVSVLGLAGTVTFSGFLDGAELDRAYAGADVFALPTYSEGFPTVLTEAMDAALPIVTTPIRGAADHFVEGEHALFVAPKSVDDLVAALVALLNDPDRRRRMGDANRRLLVDFEPSVVVREYMRALESVVTVAGVPDGAGP